MGALQLPVADSIRQLSDCFYRLDKVAKRPRRFRARLELNLVLRRRSILSKQCKLLNAQACGHFDTKVPLASERGVASLSNVPHTPSPLARALRACLFYGLRLQEPGAERPDFDAKPSSQSGAGGVGRGRQCSNHPSCCLCVPSACAQRVSAVHHGHLQKLISVTFCAVVAQMCPCLGPFEVLSEPHDCNLCCGDFIRLSKFNTRVPTCSTARRTIYSET